jgi:hypothetical protein
MACRFLTDLRLKILAGNGKIILLWGRVASTGEVSYGIAS